MDFYKIIVVIKFAPCKANVEQCGAEFVISPINHNYEPKTGVSVAAKISKEVNKRSMERLLGCSMQS